MTINDDVCQNMNATEILCYLRSKYSNVGSRLDALVKLKKFMSTKESATFCNQLKLSSDEYKQICVKRRHQLMTEKMRPRLAARQSYFQSLHTIACQRHLVNCCPVWFFLLDSNLLLYLKTRTTC